MATPSTGKLERKCMQGFCPTNFLNLILSVKSLWQRGLLQIRCEQESAMCRHKSSNAGLQLPRFANLLLLSMFVSTLVKMILFFSFLFSEIGLCVAEGIPKRLFRFV